jgi:hypothetical protein
MTFDYSLTSFKRWAPDEPQNVDWNVVLTSGLFFVTIPTALLSNILNQASVSLSPKVIAKDVNQTKWLGVQDAVARGMSLTPPWGLIDASNRLNIAQGKHRFQYQICSNVQEVTIGVSGSDLTTLQGWNVIKSSHAAT